MNYNNIFMETLKKLTLVELLELAKGVDYIPSSVPEEKWTTEEIYYGALSETINSRYQVRASEIICGFFPPLKLLFKKTIKNYIIEMSNRKQKLNLVELSA
jgi:hypothetical protein|tara:strand:- start:197 stop:499 length:303 start_codon:yes stop_codon:yes gene_type:complete